MIPLSATPFKTIVFLIKLNIRKVVLVWNRDWQCTGDCVLLFHTRSNLHQKACKESIDKTGVINYMTT